MIVVRNVFKLKFGKAREATAAWKEGRGLFERAGIPRERTRLLTDLVGPFYTMVVETTYERLGEFESSAKSAMAGKEWQDWYARIQAVSEGGYREIFTIVE
jgi:hypothetical protein